MVACCAIGNPEAFFEQVRLAGAVVVKKIALPDHDHFSSATLSKILEMAKGTDGVILTEKDWVKVRRRDALGGGTRVWYPQSCIEIMENEGQLAGCLCKVFDRSELN